MARIVRVSAEDSCSARKAKNILRRIEIQEREQPTSGWYTRFELENAHRRLKPESPVAGPAGIHDSDHDVNQGEQRPMGVTEDDNLGFGECGIESLRGRGAQLVPMSHDDIEALELHAGNLRKPATHLVSIGIAVHCGDRSERLELSQEIQGPQVPRMDDVVYSRKGSKHFRT